MAMLTSTIDRYTRWYQQARRHFGVGPANMTTQAAVRGFIGGLREDKPGEPLAYITWLRWKDFCNDGNMPIVGLPRHGVYFGDRRHVGADMAERFGEIEGRIGKNVPRARSMADSLEAGTPAANAWVKNMSAVPSRPALEAAYEVIRDPLLLESGKPVTLNPQALLPA